MADDSQGIDWGKLIAGLLGAGGAGLGIAGGIANQQQQQAQYQLLLSLFNLYNAQKQGYNAQQLAAYQQQVAQALQNFQNVQQTYQERQAIGQTLQDPNKVAAGVQGYLNPFLSTMEDQTAQSVLRNLPGLSGGAVNQAVANAEGNLLSGQYQQALQNYLATQQGALGAYSYPPEGQLTPNPQAPSTALGNQPAVPGGSSTAGSLSALGPAISTILQGLGLAPSAYQALAKALGITPGGGGGSSDGLDINAGGGTDSGIGTGTAYPPPDTSGLNLGGGAGDVTYT